MSHKIEAHRLNFKPVYHFFGQYTFPRVIAIISLDMNIIFPWTQRIWHSYIRSTRGRNLNKGCNSDTDRSYKTTRCYLWSLCSNGSNNHDLSCLSDTWGTGLQSLVFKKKSCKTCTVKYSKHRKQKESKAIVDLLDYWATPGGTAIPGRPVARAEQAPGISPVSKNQFNIVVARKPRIRY